MRDWESYTATSLRELGIKSSKSMGQNFLISYKIINDILEYAKINPNDVIYEIGGGLGILTEGLISTNANINVIEKDDTLAKFLHKQYSKKVNIINNDVLNIEFPTNIRIIANLPYAISTLLISKILHSQIRDAIIMIQKEVAQRCLSLPGEKNYSRLTLLCNLHADVEKVFTVSPDVFFPKPKIESTVIHLIKYDKKINHSHDQIESLARNLFTLKKRTLRSVLRSFLKRKDIDPRVWENISFKSKRIYELTIQEFDQLLDHLIEYKAWPLT